jgi:hypothetical protein
VNEVVEGLARHGSYLAGKLLLQASRAALDVRSKVASSDLEAWQERTSIFFVLAIGRSGSMFLSHLLSRSSGASVCHEPVLADFAAYPRAYFDEEAAQTYLRQFRKEEIYLRLRGKGVRIYGEVNTNLRRHCKALRREFPNSALLHLVRDGRDVVRSIMSRRTFKLWDPVTSLIHPKEEDLWRSAWPRMSRFERCCWYWMVENRYLRTCADKTVRFENLLSDYGYLRRNIVDPLSLHISRDQWRSAVKRPKNTTKRYRIPHWSHWDADMRDAFDKICGEEMQRNEYEMRWHSESPL